MRAFLAVVLLVGCASCGGTTDRPAAPRSSAIPSVTDVAGEVVVTDLKAVRTDPAGETCTAVAPYDDIAVGSLVTVRSDTGVRVAVAKLSAGRLTEGSDGRAPGCAFAFSFTEAPAGRPTYYASVEDRPKVRVPIADITRIRIDVPAS